MPPAAPSFPSCRKRMGRKGALGDAGCILRCDSGRNLIYRYYEHTYSPYGRFGTRRLLWCTKFVNSCDSISAVKTPFVQNLQGSTDSPEFCRGRRLCRPWKCCEFAGDFRKTVQTAGPMWASASQRLPSDSRGSGTKGLRGFECCKFTNYRLF